MLRKLLHLCGSPTPPPELDAWIRTISQSLDLPGSHFDPMLLFRRDTIRIRYQIFLEEAAEYLQAYRRLSLCHSHLYSFQHLARRIEHVLRRSRYQRDAIIECIVAIGSQLNGSPVPRDILIPLRLCWYLIH